MARNKERSNNPSQQRKGNPTDSGKYAAETKNVLNVDDMEREEEIEEKFLDDDGNPSPDARKHSHINRGTHKPEIDNNKYN